MSALLWAEHGAVRKIHAGTERVSLQLRADEDPNGEVYCGACAYAWRMIPPYS